MTLSSSVENCNWELYLFKDLTIVYEQQIIKPLRIPLQHWKITPWILLYKILLLKAPKVWRKPSTVCSKKITGFFSECECSHLSLFRPSQKLFNVLCCALWQYFFAWKFSLSLVFMANISLNVELHKHFWHMWKKLGNI